MRNMMRTGQGRERGSASPFHAMQLLPTNRCGPAISVGHACGTGAAPTDPPSPPQGLLLREVAVRPPQTDHPHQPTDSPHPIQDPSKPHTASHVPTLRSPATTRGPHAHPTDANTPSHRSPAPAHTSPVPPHEPTTTPQTPKYMRRGPSPPSQPFTPTQRSSPCLPWTHNKPMDPTQLHQCPPRPLSTLLAGFAPKAQWAVAAETPPLMHAGATVVACIGVTQGLLGRTTWEATQGSHATHDLGSLAPWGTITRTPLNPYPAP